MTVKNKILFVLALVLLLTDNTISYGQADTVRPRYGLFASFGLDMHSPGFRGLPNIKSCCPGYENTISTGMKGGLVYEHALGSYLLLGLRGNYSINNVDFIFDEHTTLARNQIEVPGIIEHSLSTELNFAGLDAFLSYKLFSFPLMFNIGASGGYLVKKKYAQSEFLKKPSDSFVFSDTETKHRNTGAGDIEETSLLMVQAMAGISYELPMNSRGTLMIVPGLEYYYGLTDIISTDSWKLNSLCATLTIKYSPHQTIYGQKSIMRIDTMEFESTYIDSDTLIAGRPWFDVGQQESGDTLYTVEIVSRVDTLIHAIEPIARLDTETRGPDVYKPELHIYANGRAGNDLNNLLVKTQMKKNVYPLLPTVFFTKGSIEIPQRYERVPSGEKFDIEALPQRPVAYHRNCLNIIAQRMERYPEATITLRGTIDPTTESGCNLARARAAEVQGYMVSRGVAPHRIIILDGSRCTPLAPNFQNAENGYAENRRVEINSDEAAILAPVVINPRPAPYLMIPSLIDIVPNGYYSATPVRWKIDISNRSGLIYGLTGRGAPSIISQKLIDMSPDRLNADNKLQFKLTVYDSAGQPHSAEKQLRLITDTTDIEIESLNLTLFDFSEGGLTVQQRDEITEFVAAADSKTEIYIHGYTDNVGTAEYNRNLGLARANAIARHIGQVNPDPVIMLVQGVGLDAMPPAIGSYNSPEERFMCRTVVIELRRKIEDRNAGMGMK